MKRLAVLSAFLVTIGGIGFQAQAGDIVDKLVLYVPNRIVSFFDIFSADVGYGPSIKADVAVTKAFDFGAGTGATSKAIKGYNRQYGFALENGYKLSFGPITAEETEVSHSTNNVQDYWVHSKGLPDYTEKVYDIEKGARDYWAVSVGAALFVEADFAIHPIDIANFVTGFFLYDIKDNEYDLDNTKF